MAQLTSISSLSNRAPGYCRSPHCLQIQSRVRSRAKHCVIPLRTDKTDCVRQGMMLISCPCAKRVFSSFHIWLLLFSSLLGWIQKHVNANCRSSLLVNKKQGGLGTEPVTGSQKHRRTQPWAHRLHSGFWVWGGALPWICTKGSERWPRRAERASLFPVPYERKEQFYHVASFKDYSPENQNSSVIGTLALMFTAWSHNSFLSKWVFFPCQTAEIINFASLAKKCFPIRDNIFSCDFSPLCYI